ATVLTLRSARIRRNFDSGSRIAEIAAEIDVLAERINGAEGQAARQSLFDAGLGGIVIIDAVAFHHINRAVALIGSALINGGRCGRNARHDHGPVVESLGQYVEGTAP